MHGTNSLQTDATPSADVGLPRRMLRHIIFGNQLSVGSRVLILDSDSEELALYLRRLGIEAWGLRDAVSAHASQCETSPAALVDDVEHLGQLPRLRFDLVLVRQPMVYRGSLNDRIALEATAHLLSALREHGRIVFLSCDGQPEQPGVARHAVSCYEQHLAVFGLSPELFEFCDGLSQPQSWTRMMLGHTRKRYRSITASAGARAAVRDAWLIAADASADDNSRPCCQWAEQALSHYVEQSPAA